MDHRIVFDPEKYRICHYIFLIDISASLWRHRGDIQTHVNTEIKRIKEGLSNNRFLLSIYYFDTHIYVGLDKHRLQSTDKIKIPKLYTFEGFTCFRDCVANILKYHKPEEKVSTVFYIYSDARDTHSRYVSDKNLRELLSVYQNKYGWLIFLMGTNKKLYTKSTLYDIPYDHIINIIQ